MKILIAPNSFKGTLTAFEAAEAIARGVRAAIPNADIKMFPMADGGEGTLDVIAAACNAKIESLPVTSADGKRIAAKIGFLELDHLPTAVVEIAQVVGLTRLNDPAVPIARRTTLGIGELVSHSLDRGSRRILVGLGGSATNDGGAGMLHALGMRFLDDDAITLEPWPAGMTRLARIDPQGLDHRLHSTQITILSDVQNVLCGERGATAVFGPQKGLCRDDIKAIDELLWQIGRLGDEWAGESCSQRAGSGAAGGLGWAFQILGGELHSGAETICELNGFDRALPDADWVITGEGRTDLQTLDGKAPCVIARKARAAKVPVTLLSGSLDESSDAKLKEAFSECYDAGRLTQSQSKNSSLDHASILAAAARIIAENRATFR